MHPRLKLWDIMDTYKLLYNPFTKANYKELEKLCLKMKWIAFIEKSFGTK